MKVLKPVAAIIILVSIVIGIRVITTTQATENTWPIVKATNTDPKEIEAIKNVLILSTRIESEAALALDPAKYSLVYIDDPAVPLSNDQLNYLTQLRKAQADTPPAEALSLNDGWLTYATAALREMKRGAEAFERLQAKAAAEKRELTAADYQGVTGVVGLPAPRPTDDGHLLKERKLVFKEIIVDEKYATVIFDDGVELTQACLVKTNEGWKIAGLRNLQVHG